MAVPQMRADTVLFNLAGGPSSGAGTASFTYTALSTSGLTDSLTINGYACYNSSGNSVSQCIDAATYNDSTSHTATLGTAGGGLEMSSGEIPQNDFVQVDFSGLTKQGFTITSVKVTMVDVIDGWDIYGSAVKGELASASTTPLSQGTDGTGGTSNINSNYPTSLATTISATSSWAIPNYLSITALQTDCHTEVASISVTYSTPEPATFVLMGFALVGMGIAGKKLRRRS
jgi:hypothetical protein